MRTLLSVPWMLMLISVGSFLAGCGEPTNRQSSSPPSSMDESKAKSATVRKSLTKSDNTKPTPSKGSPESRSEKVETTTSKEVVLSDTGTIASRRDEEPLSIWIDLKDQKESRVIDIDDPFRVVVRNRSGQPIWIWNPHVKNGYYQLSFRFINNENGDEYIARKRQIKNEQFWKVLEDSIEPNSETIEIAPNEDFSFQVLLSDFKWGERGWNGLPDPNSGIDWSIRAQLDSSVKSLKADQPIWIGKIQNTNQTAKLVASGSKTPHDYLWNGFPGRALEVMKADSKWIARLDDESRTPLHIAARFGHVEVVKWLLENGADADAVAYNGFTPLHLASNREVVRLILEQKPDLSTLDVQGRTPLQDAVANLIDAQEERPELYSDKDRRKWKSIIDLYLESGAEYDIITAIYLNDIDRVKQILKKSPELADDFQNSSPLRRAVSLGRVEICRYLVKQHDVDVNDFERGVGYPIIIGALNYPAIARLLIEHGADLETRITWQGGRTGVWIIGDDATALHFAASYGVPETINLLIDNGVDIFATAHDSFDEDDKQTALEVASYFGKADNAAAILNHPKFKRLDNQQLRQQLLDKCVSLGVSTTWLEHDADREKLLEILLEKGANPNFEVDGVKAIQAAARQIHPHSKAENQKIRRLISRLVKYGAELDVFSAVAIGDKAQVARLLKENPKSANARAADGYPALHFAVGMNDIEIVKALLSAGVDVDIPNKSEDTGYVDETALHNAAFWGRLEIGRLLIEAGADVNALTQQKSTPLHSAARMTNVEFARLLLENGAKIDSQDRDGETPLDWCRELNSTNADRIEKVFRDFQGKNQQ